MQNRLLKWSLRISFSFLRYFEENKLFYLYNLLELQKCIQKIEREYYDENVFLKVDRASSKLNFLFHYKSKKFSNLYEIRRVHSVGSNVENSIRFALFVGSDFFDSIGCIIECRIFDIRSALLRMSDFRHSTSEATFFGFSAFDRPSVKCRIYIHCIVVFKFYIAIVERIYYF